MASRPHLVAALMLMVTVMTSAGVPVTSSSSVLSQPSIIDVTHSTGITINNKKESIVKGLLVDNNLGNKYFLVKPHQANKAISVSNLNKDSDMSVVPHSRSKRFVFGGLRNIAVPLTIFHYLGFMPMRVPGLPYHIDPGLPDYTAYEPYNELSYPEEPLYSRSYFENNRRRRRRQQAI